MTVDLNTGTMLWSLSAMRLSTAAANSVDRSLKRFVRAPASTRAASPDDTPPTSSTNDSSSELVFLVTFFADQKYELSLTCKS
jgi:hypothetical protein